MNRWTLLAAAIGCEVTASLSLKAALDQPLFLLAVVIGYVSSFTFLGLVLRAGMPLGVAYGIWAALGVASTAVLSAVLFDETITVVMGLGIALVIAGVLLVEFGSHTASPDVAVVES